MPSYLIDLKNEIEAGVSLAPKLVSTNTDATGAAVDCSNMTGKVAAKLAVGTMTGTSPTMDLKMQSNTTSATTGFTDISGATFTQVTTTGAGETILFDVPDGRHWVRVTGTCGTQVTGAMSTVQVFGQKKYAGTTNTGASRSPST